MVKQLRPTAKHNTLWNGVDFRQHLEVVLVLEVDQQYSEVGTAQIEREEFALF